MVRVDNTSAAKIQENLTYGCAAVSLKAEVNFFLFLLLFLLLIYLIFLNAKYIYFFVFVVFAFVVHFN